MDIVAVLMAWAVAHSGYSAAPDLPRIEFLPTQAFIEQVCPQHAQCTVKGYYADGSQTIVLHESLRDLKRNRRARAMLVHEIVHYLQDRSGRWGRKPARAGLSASAKPTGCSCVTWRRKARTRHGC